VNDINLILIGIIAILGLSNSVAILIQGRKYERMKLAIEAIGEQSDQVCEYLFDTGRDVVIDPDDSTGEWERLA